MGHLCTFEAFVKLHKDQLVSSGIPERYWRTVKEKVQKQTFDIGHVFSLVSIDYEREREPFEFAWGLTANTDVNKDDPHQIYLIDHAWTFRTNHAKSQLLQNANLRERLSKMLAIDISDLSEDEAADTLFNEVWTLCNTYSIANAGNIEDRLPVWYVMDEIGSAVMHSDTPNCKIVPFVYVNEQITYSLLFPLVDIDEGDLAYCDFTDGLYDDDMIQRAAALLPWYPKEFELSFMPKMPGSDYYLGGHVKESLPQILNEIVSIKSKYKVYTEYALIKDHLTDERFEFTDNEAEADILWLTKHFKDYRKLSETPGKFINQFPFEYVFTVKDLLCLTCRRASANNSIHSPAWLPITYNLKTEIGNFISYFQHREKEGLDNYWIVKPYNLARSLDTHITNNVRYIARLPVTGPKIVQKYISNPVLFLRPECEGSVKFDLRYVILLKSAKPLKAYVYKQFFLRFANKPFELNDFHVYEKHFTVMNYEENAQLRHMLCSEFISKWNEQQSTRWDDVQKSILDMLKKILECGVMEQPPCGIAHSPQSRALYAADIMLEWTKTKEIQPKILEINWTPDCKRACAYYPNFYNDIFKLLFLNENLDAFIPL